MNSVTAPALAVVERAKRNEVRLLVAFFAFVVAGLIVIVALIGLSLHDQNTLLQRSSSNVQRDLARAQRQVDADNALLVTIGDRLRTFIAELATLEAQLRAIAATPPQAAALGSGAAPHSPRVRVASAVAAEPVTPDVLRPSHPAPRSVRVVADIDHKHHGGGRGHLPFRHAR